MEKEKILPLMQISTFIFQNEIVDGVKEAFAENVDNSMLKWLMEKAAQQKKRDQNNNSAWVNFITQLDSENSSILMEFIAKKQDYIRKEIEFTEKMLSKNL